jgi:hypothetical protein
MGERSFVSAIGDRLEADRFAIAHISESRYGAPNFMEG